MVDYELIDLLYGGDPLANAVVAGPLIAGAIFGAGTAAAIIAGQVINLAVSLLFAFLFRPNQPDREIPPNATTVLKQAVPPRVFGYDRSRPRGAYIFFEERAGRSVDIIAICTGRIRGILEMYFHDDLVRRASDGTIQAVHEQDGRYNIGVRTTFRLGLSTQTAFSLGITDVGVDMTDLWSSDHRVRGVALCRLWARSGNNPEEHARNYPNGRPEATHVIDFPAVWDFRDPTQSQTSIATWVNYPLWSPGTYAKGDRVVHVHGKNPTDSTVPHDGVVYLSLVDSNTAEPGVLDSAWVRVSANPVLQLIDYFTNKDYGMGFPVSQVITAHNKQHLIDQANLCDSLVMRKDGAQEPAYRSAGWAYYDTPPSRVTEAILSTCDGWMADNEDGSIALWVGNFAYWNALPSSDKILIGDNVIIGVTLMGGIDDEDAVNVVEWTYSRIDNAYKESPGDPWREEDDISERGTMRVDSQPLLWIQSHAQGRRVIKRRMNRTRWLRGVMSTNLAGLMVIGQRWIRCQYVRMPDLADAILEIKPPRIDILGRRVTFEFIVVDTSQIDAFDPETEEGTEPPLPEKNASGEREPTPPATVSGLNAVPGVQGGSGKVDLSWVNPNSANFHNTRLYVNTVEDVFDGEDTVQIAVLFGSPNQLMTYAHVGLSPGTYHYWVIAANAAGDESAPVGTGPVVVTGTATPPDQVVNLAADTATVGRVELTWNNPNDSRFLKARVYRAPIGSNTVINGGYGSDVSWDKGDGWSIASGVATRTPQAEASDISQSQSFTVSRDYEFQFDITARTAGNVHPRFLGGAGVAGTARNAVGTYTEDLTAISGNNAIALRANAAADLSVDNVSRRLVPIFSEAVAQAELFGSPNQAMSYVQTGLSAGKYYYWVTSVDSNNVESAPVATGKLTVT